MLNEVVATGHELLLRQAASVVAPGGRLVIGVTGDEYLRAKDKALSIMIEPLGERMIRAVHCVRQARPDVAVCPVELTDPYGPSITDPKMDMIVVSKETQAGGAMCNEIRAGKGWPAMAVETIDLVSEGGAVGEHVPVDQKMSSSGARAAAVGTLLDGDALFCRQSPSSRPYTIGLTGGIASGKSLVSKLLAEAHPAEVEVIDCDKLGHSAYLKGTECFDQLVAEFGAQIVGEDGEVNRRALGPIVFASPDRLQALNGIVWPVIRAMVLDHIAASTAKVCVVEAAVLLLAGWESLVDEVWLVSVRRQVALERLMARNKIDEATALQKIDAQQLTMSPTVAYNKAHVLISNDLSIDHLGDVLRGAWDKLDARRERTLASIAAAGGAESLPARWVALSEGLGLEPDRQAVWWRVLRDRYSHRRRHHRTLTYLETLFEAYDSCHSQLSQPASVALALFFHGADWDPRRSAAENAEKSAARCREFCAALNPPMGPGEASAADWIERVGEGGAAEGDLAFFLDVLDSPLAAEPSSYSAAALAAHLESHHLSDAEWRVARPAYLDARYLKPPQIFRTKHFATHEEAARRNIAAEIDALRAMRGDSVDESPKATRSSY